MYIQYMYSLLRAVTHVDVMSLQEKLQATMLAVSSLKLNFR